MGQDGEDTVQRDLWWRLGLATVGTVVRLAFRLRFEGTEHIPRTGPALLACNHISVLDPPIVALALSDRGRTVRFLAAAEFFDRPLVGWGLRTLKQIPIHRGAKDWEALREVAEVIRRGALAGGVPVVPAAIWGTHRRWPRGRFRFTPPLRMPVAAVFGPSIAPDGDPQDPDAVQSFTDRIMDGIGECLGRARVLSD